MERLTTEYLSFEDAYDRMQGHVALLHEEESVTIFIAAGRINYETELSPMKVPPLTNSARDGYALRQSEFNSTAPLAVAGRLLSVHLSGRKRGQEAVFVGRRC